MLEHNIYNTFKESFREFQNSSGFLDRLVSNEAIMDHLEKDLRRGEEYIRKKKDNLNKAFQKNVEAFRAMTASWFMFELEHSLRVKE